MLTISLVISIISLFFIVVEDIRNRLIPDVWLWPLLLAGLYSYAAAPDHIIAAIIGYALGYILMIATIKKEAFGYGDVKLLSVAGLWLGIKGMSVAVVAACVVGIIFGLIRKQKFIPFAPFLAAGAVIYYLTKELLWLI